jgi:hypothetical protein
MKYDENLEKKLENALLEKNSKSYFQLVSSQAVTN